MIKHLKILRQIERENKIVSAERYSSTVETIRSLLWVWFTMQCNPENSLLVICIFFFTKKLLFTSPLLFRLWRDYTTKKNVQKIVSVTIMYANLYTLTYSLSLSWSTQSTVGHKPFHIPPHVHETYVDDITKVIVQCMPSITTWQYSSSMSGEHERMEFMRLVATIVSILDMFPCQSGRVLATLGP